MKKLQGILNRLMYKDLATVRRQVEGTDAEGGACYVLQDVYIDIPCHLAQYGKELASHSEDRAFKLVTDLRLDCSPEYDILPNDVIHITHRGQEFVLNAGRAFKYPTHQEIQVRRSGESE